MKVGIIDVNDLRYNETDMSHSNFSHEKIIDILSDYITLKNVTDEDEMMNTVVNEVVYKDVEYPIHTATVRNVDNDLYQMCHISQSKEIYEEMKSKSVGYNGIASYLTDMGLKVYGKAVIFKIDTATDPNKLKTITLDEITDILISKFVHKGVILSTDGSVNEFKFIFNPIDWLQPTEFSKHKYYETEILGKVLMLFIDTTATVINNSASSIYMQQIKGRVIIGMRNQYSDMNDTDVQYEDIDCDIFKRILHLCRDPMQVRSLVDGEDTIGQVINGRRSYNNFYKILKNRNISEQSQTNVGP